MINTFHPVDVIVVNYNDAGTTINLIKRIAGYRSVNYIVVVDNCSTDDSYSMLSQYIDDRVHVIRAPRNGGYGYGNNYGFSYLRTISNSKYVLIANPDTKFEDTTIQNISLFLDENPEYAVAAPKMLDPTGKEQIYSAIRIPDSWSFIFSLDLIYSHIFKPALYNPSELFDDAVSDVDAVSGSLFMVNAQYMYDYGMFDEDVFLYYEEMILAIKFKRAHLKECIISGYTFIHEHSVSIDKTYSTLPAKRRLMMKSALIVLQKYFSMLDLG